MYLFSVNFLVFFIFFFFFKQKTAYEMPKRLEFRRVLFRSHRDQRLVGVGHDAAEAAVARAFERRVHLIFRDLTLEQRGEVDDRHCGRWDPERHPCELALRSEERRVGKECSTRWSA